jgi:hypothetical protein
MCRVKLAWFAGKVQHGFWLLPGTAVRLLKTKPDDESNEEH